jgi:Cu2+-exporting ATPase
MLYGSNAFPAIFLNNSEYADGSVFVYLETVTVILTLVLLGQLLEARAYNRTNRQ